MPSLSPTTEEPTASPTKFPTTDEPTFVPTTAPFCVEPCNDFVPRDVGVDAWFDAGGERFTCAHYGVAPSEFCTNEELDEYENFGLIAREACCACNGGDLCGRACEVNVMIETCADDSAGTMTFPTVTICDTFGNCREDVLLDPLFDAIPGNPDDAIVSGTKYSWDVSTGMFEGEAESITFNVNGIDGICIEKVWVDYSLRAEGPIYMDEEECGSVEAGVCDKGFYPKGVIVFSTCTAWTGNSEFNMIQGSETFITDIPADTNDLQISLTSEVDIDLQLFVGDVCVAGYGCENPDESTFKYNGMWITFSGDDRSAPVVETISIPRTTDALKLLVKAYATGAGEVTYSWSSIDPCPADLSGCLPCDDYPGCKDGLVPICPSGDLPACATEEDAALYYAAFDDNFPADAECLKEFTVDAPPCLPDWPTWSPTTTPSRTPSQTPSVMPTVDPTVAPTRTPSAAPTTEEPTVDPSVSPTVDPTVSPTRTPSRTPSAAPTTEEPTVGPSASPTTEEPTVDPTASPSFSPTRTPSRTPSQTPTKSPEGCVEFMAEYEQAEIDMEATQERCDDVQEELTILRGECEFGEVCPRCGAPDFDDGSDPRYVTDLVGIAEIDAGMLLDAGFEQVDDLVYYAGEIFVRLDSNLFQRTCVGYNPTANKWCPTGRLVCADDEKFGTLEQVVEVLNVAYERADKFHFDCPTGCSALPAFYEEIFSEYGVDISDYCVENGQYYYINRDDGRRIFTCVGYGGTYEVCPAHNIFCCGYDDRQGLKTYGWLGMQARALSVAQNMNSKTHPYCPSYGYN